MGSGRDDARSNRARPPCREPVKPTARISRCCTRATPVSRPSTWPKVPSGAPAVASASATIVGGAAREPRMRRMALDDHRASRRERRRGVAAGDREREREVRGAEDRDGAERSQHPAKVGSRRRGGRVRVVDRRLEVRPLDHGRREQAQLRGRARELAGEACRAEVRLLVGEGDELAGGPVERVGHGGQPGRPFAPPSRRPSSRRRRERRRRPRRASGGWSWSSWSVVVMVPPCGRRMPRHPLEVR